MKNIGLLFIKVKKNLNLVRYDFLTNWHEATAL